MVDAEKKVKNRWRFAHLFSRPNFTEVTYVKDANVGHTVKFIPLVVEKTRWMMREYVKQELRFLPTRQALRKLWDFVKEYIQYEKDERGKEQVRSSRRLFWEGKGDCDCFTVFISTGTTWLKHIREIILRITKYGGKNFQHVYPIVVLQSGERIVMDAVAKAWNYEEPYTEKEDYKMELNYLDGIDWENDPTQETAEMGKLFDFLKRKDPNHTPLKDKLQNVGSKIKQAGGKALHAVNRVNPATVLLRNGLLAAMKLNVFKVGQRLKYAYWSDEKARAKGVNMQKFEQLKKLKDKLEKIFHGAGGKSENFRESILTGRGNTNKAVNGLGYLPPENLYQMSEKTPLPYLLGQDMYYGENMENLEELSGLGEPATAVSIASATGILAAISDLLKKLGNIFEGQKVQEAEDFKNVEQTDLEAAKTNQTDLDKLIHEQNVQEPPPVESENPNPQQRSVETPPADESTKPKEGFWQKNKGWLKPTLIATGSVCTLGLGYALLRPKKPSLSGVEGTKDNRTKTKEDRQRSKEDRHGTQEDGVGGKRKKRKRLPKQSSFLAGTIKEVKLM